VQYNPGGINAVTEFCQITRHKFIHPRGSVCVNGQDVHSVIRARRHLALITAALLLDEAFAHLDENADGPIAPVCPV
jgi:hypothetical protein